MSFRKTKKRRTLKARWTVEFDNDIRTIINPSVIKDLSEQLRKSMEEKDK